jgi:hypothetical protein
MMMNLRASADFVEPFGICYGCGDFVMWNLDETLFFDEIVAVCDSLWWFSELVMVVCELVMVVLGWLWWF